MKLDCKVEKRDLEVGAGFRNGRIYSISDKDAADERGALGTIENIGNEIEGEKLGERKSAIGLQLLSGRFSFNRTLSSRQSGWPYCRHVDGNRGPALPGVLPPAHDPKSRKKLVATNKHEATH